MIGKSASNKAANVQRDAAAQAAALQQEQLQFTKDSTLFNRATGQNALAKIADIFGIQRPVDTTIGIERDLAYTSGRPLPVTGGQQGGVGTPPIGAQGAPIGQGGGQLSGLFTPQELFAAQNLGTVTKTRNDKTRSTYEEYVGGDRLKAIRAVGDTLRQTPEQLREEASGRGYFDYSPFTADERKQIQGLFKDAADGKINQNDFYAGKFGAAVVPVSAQPQTPAPTNNAPSGNGVAQTPMQQALDAYNAQLNSASPTVAAPNNQPVNTNSQPISVAQILQGLTQPNSSMIAGQNSDPIRSQLATTLLNEVANNQLNQDNILAGNVTNSLPTLFDITRGEQKTTQDFIRNNFKTDPGYQFMVDEGIKAIKRNASRNGTLGGGQLFKELLQYTTGLADQSYSNYANRTEQALSGLRGQALGQFNNDRNFAFNAREGVINNLMRLAGIGGEANKVVNSIGADAATNTGQILTQGSVAQANQIIGGANAMTDGINQGITALSQLFNRNNNTQANGGFSITDLFGGSNPIKNSTSIFKGGMTGL